MKLLVTGASGFVGRNILPELLAAGHEVRGLTRQSQDPFSLPELEWRRVDDIGPGTDWSVLLGGIDAIVHLAGHAHGNDAEAHDHINHHGTRRLAEAAAGRVGRLVFLSTIAVHGLRQSDQAIDEATPVRPDGPYGESKACAEDALIRYHGKHWLETVCLRVPLLVGPDAPGNLGRLQRAVARGWLLPFGAVSNQRSLLGLDHLAQAIVRVLAAERIHSPVHSLADAEALSTPEIIRALALGAGRSPRLPALPPGLLRAGAGLLGQQAAAEQLLGSLTVSSQAFQAAYGKAQRIPTRDALSRSQRDTMAGQGQNGARP